MKPLLETLMEIVVQALFWGFLPLIPSGSVLVFEMELLEVLADSPEPQLMPLPFNSGR